MELAVGEIMSGKVTGITKFGAFVSLPEGKTGLVHISEVHQTYVNNIRDHLTEGQEVKVKVISIDESGRVNLSIKKAQENNHVPRSTKRGQRSSGSNYSARPAAKDAPTSFEDKLKHFMQDSESRMADYRHNIDRKNGSRRRK